MQVDIQSNLTLILKQTIPINKQPCLRCLNKTTLFKKKHSFIRLTSLDFRYFPPTITYTYGQLSNMFSANRR